MTIKNSIIYGQHNYVLLCFKILYVKFGFDSGFKLVKFKHSDVNTEIIP